MTSYDTRKGWMFSNSTRIYVPLTIRVNATALNGTELAGVVSNHAEVLWVDAGDPNNSEHIEALRTEGQRLLTELYGDEHGKD